MIGASRESYAALRVSLDGRRNDPGLPQLAGELMAASDVIASDQALRSILADSGQPGQSRAGLVESLFGTRLSPLAVGLLGELAQSRWSSPSDMAAAMAGLAAQAAFLQAEMTGTLERVAGELFTVREALSGSAEMQMALTNPALAAREKSSLVNELLAQRAEPVTVEVLAFTLSHLQGERVDAAIDELTALAAEQLDRSVAEVRVARELDEEQRARLGAALSKLHGRKVRLNVAVDPSVIGGAAVRIGDEVIDGTLASRLEQARRIVGR